MRNADHRVVGHRDRLVVAAGEGQVLRHAEGPGEHPPAVERRPHQSPRQVPQQGVLDEHPPVLRPVQRQPVTIACSRRRIWSRAMVRTSFRRP